MKRGIDDNVRHAVIEYKNCEGSIDNLPKVFKRTERAIHSPCVIVLLVVEVDLNIEYITNN